MTARRFGSFVFTLCFFVFLVFVFMFSARVWAQIHSDPAPLDNPVLAIAKEEMTSYWSGLWSAVKDTFSEAFRQLFVSVHQTIALALAGWLLLKARSLWEKMKPRVDEVIDARLESLTVEQKKQAKQYIDDLIRANIDLVEAAFQKNRAASVPASPAEEVTDDVDRSKEKMVSVVNMVLHELTQQGLTRIVGDINDQLVQDIVLQVEKILLEKKAEAGGVFATMRSGGGNVRASASARLRGMLSSVELAAPQRNDLVRKVVEKVF